MGACCTSVPTGETMNTKEVLTFDPSSLDSFGDGCLVKRRKKFFHFDVVLIEGFVYGHNYIHRGTQTVIIYEIMYFCGQIIADIAASNDNRVITIKFSNPLTIDLFETLQQQIFHQPFVLHLKWNPITTKSSLLPRQTRLIATEYQRMLHKNGSINAMEIKHTDSEIYIIIEKYNASLWSFPKQRQDWDLQDCLHWFISLDTIHIVNKRALTAIFESNRNIISGLDLERKSHETMLLMNKICFDDRHRENMMYSLNLSQAEMEYSQMTQQEIIDRAKSILSEPARIDHSKLDLKCIATYHQNNMDVFQQILIDSV
eukprot:423457_1